MKKREIPDNRCLAADRKHQGNIIEIMPVVKLGPEAQPMDANNRVVLFLLDT